MNINITNQKKIPLLSRVDIEADLTYSGATPDRNKIRKQLASKLGCKESLLIIKKIESAKYGFSQSTITAFQYMDEETLKKTASMYLKKRGPQSKEEDKPEEPEKREAPSQVTDKENKPESKEEGKKDDSQEKEAPAEKKDTEDKSEKKPADDKLDEKEGKADEKKASPEPEEKPEKKSD